MCDKMKVAWRAGDRDGELLGFEFGQRDFPGNDVRPRDFVFIEREKEPCKAAACCDKFKYFPFEIVRIRHKEIESTFG